MVDKHRTPNAIFRAVRLEEFGGISRAKFAELMQEVADRLGENVSCTERTVARFEDGEVARPLAPYQRVLENLCRRPIADLGFSKAATSRTPQQRPDAAFNLRAKHGWTQDDAKSMLLSITEEDPMKRRDFFVSVSGVVVVATAQSWAATWPDITFDDSALKVLSPATIDAVETIAAQLRKMENECGGEAIFDSVRSQLSLVARLLKSSNYGAEANKRLYGLAAELSRLAGWSCFDTGHYGPAYRYYSSALRCAHAAGDREAGAHIVSYMSIQEAWTGNPSDAVELIDTTAAFDGQYRPIVESILSARKALAEAKAGNRQSCLRALYVSAERFAEAGVGGEQPDWSDYFDYSLMISQAGHCQLDLGNPAAAREALEVALANRDESSTRDRSIWYSRLAVACLKERDLESAIDAGRKALELVAVAPSSRSADHVHSLRRELRAYRREGMVREFLEAARDALSN